MNPKILLINPTFYFLRKLHILPIGLINLGTIIDQAGFDVKLIDLNAEQPYGDDFYPCPLTPDKFLQKFKQYDPDIVGLTSYTENHQLAMKIAEMCKDENENIKIIYGGIHATFQAFECLTKYPYLDVVARGETEHIIVDLIRGLLGEKRLEEIPNIFFKYNGIIKYSNLFTLPDVNTIPTPNLSLIKDKYYHSFLLQIEFSRGCPYNCIFCSLAPLSNRNVRFFPINRIIETLKLYEDWFGNFSFSISDANFLFSHKRIYRFLEEVKKSKIELKDWLFESRITSVNRNILKELEKFNATTLTLGIEDIHDSILKILGKQQTFQQIERVLKIIREFNFLVHSNFIIGLPFQTKEHMLENIEYSNKLDMCTFPTLTPFPGTPIFSTPEQFGLTILTKDWKLYTMRDLVMDSASFPLDQQREIRELAWNHLVRHLHEKDFISYHEKKNYELILELGFEKWLEQWKKAHSTSW